MALSFPIPSHHDDPEPFTAPDLTLVEPSDDLQWSPFDPALVDHPQRPTSLSALAIFALGLATAVMFVTSAPGIAAAAVVVGIIGGGILNAPAGVERRRTVAALGLPTLGLTVLTLAFVGSF
ncbi:MAG: hypothetical protein JJE52_07005 [Acidimicrobiia bacterium]|nr:hypothetical protein [Acidimicrobiia bacterium]